MYVINLVAWETELKDKIRHRKTEYDRAVRRKMRNSNIRKSEEELELSRFYFARLYARMGWGSPPFPPKEPCAVVKCKDFRHSSTDSAHLKDEPQKP